MGSHCHGSSTTRGVVHNSRLTESCSVSLFYSGAKDLNQGYFTEVSGNSEFEILIAIRSYQPLGLLAAAFSGAAAAVSYLSYSGDPTVAGIKVATESCPSQPELFSRRPKCQTKG